MTLPQVLNILSATAVMLFGIYSFIAPRGAAALLHLSLPDARGAAEMRVGFGGLLIGIGLIVILGRDPAMSKVIAAAWFGSAIARLASIVLERPPLTIDYVGTLLGEIAFGIFSLAS